MTGTHTEEAKTSLERWMRLKNLEMGMKNLAAEWKSLSQCLGPKSAKYYRVLAVELEARVEEIMQEDIQYEDVD